MDSELELAQLLCTRLCHDLAGPIGAVAAGVELIGDDPQAADPETLGLIGTSSAAASFKLKFLRAVLGTDNTVNGAPAELTSLLDGYLGATSAGDGRPVVQWPVPHDFAQLPQVLGPRWRQAVLNLCLVALEMQPGCRELKVSLAPREAGRPAVVVEAKCGNGRVMTARADLADALVGAPAAALTAKTVQAVLAGRMIRATGGSLGVAKGDGAVAITASF
jgi:histidine phosphotransferase ChpT